MDLFLHQRHYHGRSADFQLSFSYSECNAFGCRRYRCYLHPGKCIRFTLQRHGRFPAGSVSVTLSSSSSINGITLTSNKPFNNICVGDNITISMNGVTAASLGTGAHWKWYTGTCGGTASYRFNGSAFHYREPYYYDYVFRTGRRNLRYDRLCILAGGCDVSSSIRKSRPGLSPLIAYSGATDSLVVTPVPGATFYHWSTNGNTNILIDGHPTPYESSSNKVMVTFVNPATNGNGIGNYHIQFFAGNACGTTNSNNIRIRATVDAPASVTGPLVVCTGSGAKTTRVAGRWRDPTGGLLVAAVPEPLQVTEPKL